MTRLILAAIILMRGFIALTFLVSVASKLLNLADFEATMNSFDILPQRFNRVGMLLVGSAEVCIVGLLAFGKTGLILGFALALATLTIFTFAVRSVIQRKLSVACNCFGLSKNVVSQATLWRNSIFITCAAIGLLLSMNVPQGSLEVVEIILLGAVSSICTLVLIHVEDLVYLFE